VPVVVPRTTPPAVGRGVGATHAAGMVVVLVVAVVVVAVVVVLVVVVVAVTTVVVVGPATSMHTVFEPRLVCPEAPTACMAKQ